MYINSAEAMTILSNAISSTAITAEEAGKALRKLATWLAAPATPGTAENSNQKEPFDFLEQNAYDSINQEQIVPLDNNNFL